MHINHMHMFAQHKTVHMCNTLLYGTLCTIYIDRAINSISIINVFVLHTTLLAVALQNNPLYKLGIIV